MADPIFEESGIRLYQGDMREALRALPDDSVDSVITDPPYGLSEEPDIEAVLRHWLAGDDYKHRGGGFMGNSWDSFVPGPSMWKEAYRVLKPGGMLAAFAGTRTADLMGIAIRLAGFSRRDTVLHIGSEVVVLDDVEFAWLYGSGFPKGGDIGKEIDVQLGAQPEAVVREFSTAEIGGEYRREASRTSGIGSAYREAAAEGTWAADAGQERVTITRATTEEGKRWEGWSTALKPANEPIILARKPLREKNIAANVMRHGTGAINIGGSSLGKDVRYNPPSAFKGEVGAPVPAGNEEHPGTVRVGRWPSNVVASHSEGCEQVGTKRVPVAGPADGTSDGFETVEEWRCAPGCQVAEIDRQGSDEIAALVLSGRDALGVSQGVTRFFYCAKPSTAEKEAGVLGPEEYVHQGAGASGFARENRVRALVQQGLSREEAEKHVRRRKNVHQTVKPIDLMRWLVRLLTSPGGVVLDPFMGSGTTGCAAVLEGCEFVGAELGERFAEIARDRIVHWRRVAEQERAQMTMF